MPEQQSIERRAAQLPSWETASSLIAQKLKIVLALDSRTIRENPRRKSFNTGLRAHRLNALRTFDPALDIWRVLKRRTKFLFLILTMRAPKRAVHLGLLGSEALGKSVQFFIVPMPKEIVCDGKNYHDHDRNHRVTHPLWIWLRLALPLPFLLLFSALL